MSAQDVIRKITIVGSAQGVDQTTASLEKLATAQGNVAVAVERQEKATISAQSAIDRLQRSLDSEYAAEQKMAAIEKTLTAARNEGLISLQRESELLGLAKLKYTEAGEAAKLMGERIDSAKEFAMGLVGGLGAGAAFAGIAELPTQIMDVVHEAAGLSHVAETIGLTTTELQELQQVGLGFHVSTDSMDSALERFSKNLAVAKTGTGELNKILAANHVIITGDVMKDFENYANLIQHASNAEDRNLLSTTAFGKSAAEMGLMFEDGAKGIQEAADAADRAGNILGGDALQQAKDLDAEFVQMKIQMDATFKDFAITTAPLVEGALQVITGSVNDLKFAIDQVKFGNISEIAKLISYGPFALPMISADQMAQQAAHISVRGATPRDTLHDGDTAWRGATVIPQAPDSAAVKQENEIKRVTDALDLQTKALTETDRQKEIDNELAKAHVTLASTEGQKIADLAGKYYDEKKAIDEANAAAQFLAQTMESALEGILDGSKSATDALGDMAKALEQAVLQAALLGSGPLGNLFGTAPTTAGQTGGFLGSLLSAFGIGGGGGATPSFDLFGSAKGNVFASPDLSAYSNQIVDRPTFFRFANGGVMGEAGSEAIMPLRRGPDGVLGVAAANSNTPISVSLSIVHQPGAQDSATAKQNGNNIDIQAIVGGAGAKDMQTPGKPMYRTLSTGFGIKPRLTAR